MKILTIDDSTSIRRIIKKCFANYACEVIEAQNGIEGLKAIIKEKPDLVLLDVTMPVMNGIQVLEKLRSAPDIGKMPIIMLTAEAGKEMVMQILKLGVRDYIVKPFTKEAIIEKVNRICTLPPKDDQEAPAPTASEKLSPGSHILVVDDKPAFVEQIQEGMQTETIHIRSATSAEEAFTFCQKHCPHLILLSLSLEAGDPYQFYRDLRSKLKHNKVPVFALAVKIDTSSHEQAEALGIHTIIHKPLDIDELRHKAIRALDLDVSEKYYKSSKAGLTISFPKQFGDDASHDIKKYLRPKAIEAIETGLQKIFIDLQILEELNTSAVKAVLEIIELSEESSLKYLIRASSHIQDQAQNLEESASWVFEPDSKACVAS